MKNFMNALEKITRQHLKSLLKKENVWGGGGAYIYREMKNDKITFHFETYKKTLTPDITLEEMMDAYQKSFHGEISVDIIFHHKVRQKSIINAIVSEKPEDKFLKQIFTTLVLDYQVPSDLEVLEYLADIKDDFAKKLLPYVFEKMSRKKAPTHLDSSLLEKHLKAIKNFTFQPREYQGLHDFFSHHQHIISHKNHQVQATILEFLKSSIPAQDWEQFSQYCHTDKGLKIQKNDKPLLEENRREVYSLVLNPSYIKQNFPFSSLESDMAGVIKDILDAFSRNGKDINISQGFSSILHGEQSHIYFMAASDAPLNKTKINKMFCVILEKYAQLIEKKFPCTKDLDDIYKYAFVASALEEKSPTKTLKI